MSFLDILGHEDSIEILKRSIDNKRIAHSYLFQGEEAIGKKKVAKVFAKALLCQEKTSTPCNTCSSCQKFDSLNNPDFTIVESKESRIKKEYIDEIIKESKNPPLEGDRKIIIIDDCDKLGVEAQNSLLKTLEEPKSYLHIILITSNPMKILPTILSRCQILKFTPVSNKLIGDFLHKKYDLAKIDADFIANFTNGSVGRSIDLVESEDFLKKRDYLIDLLNEIIVHNNKIMIFSSYDFFKENKESSREILDLLIFWFRDLYIYKEVGDSELILNKDKKSYLQEQSFLSFYKINDIIDNIIQAKNDLYLNVNHQLLMETMLLNMQEVK